MWVLLMFNGAQLFFASSWRPALPFGKEKRLSRPPISLMGYHRPFAFLMSFAKLLPLAPKNCWKPCCRNHWKGQTNSKLPPFRALQGYVGAIHRPTSWSNFDPHPPLKKCFWGSGTYFRLSSAWFLFYFYFLLFFASNVDVFGNTTTSMSTTDL